MQAGPPLPQGGGGAEKDAREGEKKRQHVEAVTKRLQSVSLLKSPSSCSSGGGPEGDKGDEGGKTVSILHLSDTHSLHRSIDERFPMPSADILCHTGDFTNEGAESEVEDFNAWLGELKESGRYKHIVVCDCITIFSSPSFIPRIHVVITAHSPCYSTHMSAAWLDACFAWTFMIL